MNATDAERTSAMIIGLWQLIVLLFGQFLYIGLSYICYVYPYQWRIAPRVQASLQKV